MKINFQLKTLIPECMAIIVMARFWQIVEARLWQQEVKNRTWA
jgi:hypothetical protein